jgi:3-isopropylmalate/(R)-2-methylmalate dehydratase small subunit
LPVVLSAEVVDVFFAAAEFGLLILIVDLEAQEVRIEAATYGFEIDPHRRHCLFEGFDDIGLSL